MIVGLARSKKPGRFEILLGFDKSHFIVTRDSVSLSCATTPHQPAFLNLNGRAGFCVRTGTLYRILGTVGHNSRAYPQLSRDHLI